MRGVLLASLVLGTTAICLAGCSEKLTGDVPVYPVSGQFTFRGKPTAGAMVTFHSAKPGEDKRFFPRATVGEDGQFQLSAFVSNDGAPEGEYIVTVYWPDPKILALDPDGESEHLPPDLLQGRFANPQVSNLRLTVPPKAMKLSPVDLASQEVVSDKPFSLPVAQ